MTKTFADAVAVVSQLSDEQQDEIARLMLSLVEQDDEAEEIDPAYLPRVLKALEQTDKGEFASDEAIEAAFRRFRR